MLFKKKKNNEKIAIQVKDSKQSLENYFDELIRTQEEELKNDFREIKRNIAILEPCDNPEAIILDEKIKLIMDKYRESSLHQSNILGHKNDENSIRAEQYQKANKDMFNKVMTILNRMFCERANLFTKQNSSIFKEDSKEVARKAEAAKTEWEIDSTLITFELERLQIFYRKQAEIQLKELIHEKWDADEENGESYEAEINEIDEKIATYEDQERAVRSKITNHKELLNRFGDLNIEKFIRNNQYAEDKFNDVFKKVVSETLELKKQRINEDKEFKRIKDVYKEENKELQSKQKAKEPSAAQIEHERRKQAKMDSQLNQINNKNQSEEVKDEETSK